MNDSKKTIEIRRAKTSAFQLLKFRNRSEKELREKLKLKKFSKSIIDEIIDYLIEHDFVNDRLFAQQWVTYRLNKPFGLYRIKLELKNKGISEDILQNALNSATKEYDEEKTVKEIALRRIEKYKGLEPQKIKQRMYGYLTRRGFSGQSINKALKEL
jgi:regulatory protein